MPQTSADGAVVPSGEIGTSKIDGIQGVDSLKLLLPTTGPLPYLVDALAGDPELLKVLSEDSAIKAIAGEGFDQLVVITFQGLAKLAEIAKNGRGRLGEILGARQEAAEEDEKAIEEAEKAAEVEAGQKTARLKLAFLEHLGEASFVDVQSLVDSLQSFATKNDLVFDFPTDSSDDALNGLEVIHEFEINGRKFAVIEENQGTEIALIWKNQAGVYRKVYRNSSFFPATC